MKKFIIILIVFLLGCEDPSNDAATPSMYHQIDTSFLNVISKEKDSIHILYRLYGIDTTEGTRLLDSLRLKVMCLNGEGLELDMLKERFKEILTARRELTDSLTRLLERNKNLIKENNEITNSFIKERAKNKVLHSELISNLSKVSAHNIEVYGTGVRLISRDSYKTSNASKIKKIIVKFTLIANSSAGRGEKSINIKIFSRDKANYMQHSENIKYDGSEQTYIFNMIPRDFEVGPHNVIISIDDEVYETTLIIT